MFYSKEYSIVKKIITIFSAEEKILQYHILGYKITVYFSMYNLAVEIDGLGHKGRDTDQQIRRQEVKEKELNCEFTRINPDKENFDVFIEIGRIQNYIIKSNEKLAKQSTKKFLIDEISNKLLSLEFKKDNSIKTKCLKYVANKILPKL